MRDAKKREYDRNPEQYIEHAREVRERQKRNDPIALMLNHKRHNAKANGIPFTITREDIVIPTHCPVLGIPLSGVGCGGGDAAPSLDRFDPSLGYVPGNVYVISKRANTLKSDGTAEEHAKVAAWMRSVTES